MERGERVGGKRVDVHVAGDGGVAHALALGWHDRHHRARLVAPLLRAALQVDLRRGPHALARPKVVPLPRGAARPAEVQGGVHRRVAAWTCPRRVRDVSARTRASEGLAAWLVGPHRHRAARASVHARAALGRVPAGQAGGGRDLCRRGDRLAADGRDVLGRVSPPRPSEPVARAARRVRLAARGRDWGESVGRRGKSA